MTSNKILAVLIPALVFTSGYLTNEIQLEGVSGATEPVTLGGVTIAGILGIVWSIYQSWSNAGGKLDGKLTNEEVASIIKGILGGLGGGLLPSLNEGNGVPSSLLPATNTPTALNLIRDLAAFIDDPTPDLNEGVLNNKLLDILTAAVQADDDGLKAAETLRARLHALSVKVLTAPTGTTPERKVSN